MSAQRGQTDGRAVATEPRSDPQTKSTIPAVTFAGHKQPSTEVSAQQAGSPDSGQQRLATGIDNEVWMDKGKQGTQKGKRKSNPNGGRGRTGNNRSRSRTASVGNGKPAPAQVERKGVDPVVELLGLLRINPSADGIKSIVDLVSEEKADYFNLGKAVRNIMNRTLTEEEETLVKKLGANA